MDLTSQGMFQMSKKTFSFVGDIKPKTLTQTIQRQHIQLKKIQQKITNYFCLPLSKIIYQRLTQSFCLIIILC